MKTLLTLICAIFVYSTMTMSRLVKCDVLNAEESENDVEAYLQRERSNIQASRATGYLPRGTILSVGTSEIDFWFNMQGIGLGEYAGWYICDGRNGTPDLRGRFIIGRDPSNTMMSNAFDQVGLTGGSYSAKLNEKNLPTHSHDVKLTSSSNGAHQHKYVDNVFGNRVTVPNGVGYVYSISVFWISFERSCLKFRHRRKWRAHSFS
jgi:hypothetical protein